MKHPQVVTQQLLPSLSALHRVDYRLKFICEQVDAERPHVVELPQVVAQQLLLTSHYLYTKLILSCDL